MDEDIFEAIQTVAPTGEDEDGDLFWKVGGFKVSLEWDNTILKLYDPDGFSHRLSKETANMLVSAITSATNKMEK